jgi:hypothetical protein
LPRISAWKMERSSFSTSTSPLARTVAVRVVVSRRPISPKLSPGRSSVSEISSSLRPVLITRAVPDTRT